MRLNQNPVPRAPYKAISRPRCLPNRTHNLSLDFIYFPGGCPAIGDFGDLPASRQAFAHTRQERPPPRRPRCKTSTEANTRPARFPFMSAQCLSYVTSFAGRRVPLGTVMRTTPGTAGGGGSPRESAADADEGRRARGFNGL